MGNANTHEIVERKDLDFGLKSDDIPRFWFGGDPFKTRFFDAMSLLFPEGEKFFIQCVRDYRDRIDDPQLEEEVKHFTFQEAQHTRVHIDFNKRVARQGVDVDAIEARQKKILAWYRRTVPRKYTLAQTAAAEHMTALMAHFVLENSELLEEADPRIRAIYLWHAIEEIEHKAVAYDVMQKVAKTGYFVRTLAMLNLSLAFPFHVLMIMRHMIRVDGFSRRERRRIWLKGLWWLYGPRGLYARMMPHYLSYYLPFYHPWKKGETRAFQRWREEYDRHGGDPVAASDSFLGAAA